MAQRKSIVLLKNGAASAGPVLPLAGKPKIYIEGIAPETAAEYGQVVGTPAEADFAILRLGAPFEPRQGFLESIFHTGSLEFSAEEKARILGILRQVPSVVDIFLERPAVIPEVSENCAALLGSFGANDRAVLDIVFGHFQPQGKLPFELPSSMEAVRKQKEDLPYDLEHPLYPFGYGLLYG